MRKTKEFSLNDPIPYIVDIGLMIGETVNGMNETVPIHTVISEYQADLESVVTALRANDPLPADLRLFVPDLWHVAKGRAADLPKEEAGRLYQAQVYGHTLGRLYMEIDYSDPIPLKNQYPGSIFKPKA